MLSPVFALIDTASALPVNEKSKSGPVRIWLSLKVADPVMSTVTFPPFPMIPVFPAVGFVVIVVPVIATN